jgi:hypothetical protein
MLDDFVERRFVFPAAVMAADVGVLRFELGFLGVQLDVLIQADASWPCRPFAKSPCV